MSSPAESAGRLRAARADPRQRFVLEWQGPVYSFVHRMVRNDAEAADITQEVFASALKHWERIDSLEVRPWIFRIARNAVYKQHRDRSKRHEKERQGAPMTPPPDPSATAERHEQQQIVQDQLAQMPEDARSLLLLRYYNGLSQREIADVLDVPRTTVASRLQSAEESLRSRLGAAGHLAIVPCLHEVMSGTPQLTVPTSVSQSLLTLAAESAGTAAVVAGVTVGGGIVSKKLFAVAAVAVAMSFAAGVGVMKVQSDGERELARAKAEQVAALQQRLDDAERESGVLQESLERARRDLKSATAELNGARTEIASLRSAQGSAVPASSSVDEAIDEGSGINWDRLAQLASANRDVVFALAEAERNDEEPKLTPEQMASYRNLAAELQRAAAQARVVAPYPILDAEFLPELMRLYVGATLELSESQTDQLQRVAVNVLKDFPIPDDATPVEAHVQRLAMLDRLQDEIDPLLSATQREDWQQMKPVWEQLRMGDRRELSVGFRTGELESRVTKEWRKHYRLSGDQSTDLNQVAGRYLEDAKNILDENGRFGNEQVELTPELDRYLREEFLALQLRYEGELLERLTAEQREDLMSRAPYYLRFTDSGSVNISDTGNGSF